MPTTLLEARDLFATSEVARAAFGDEVVDHYVHAADIELRAFEAAVTDWERCPRVRTAVSDTVPQAAEITALDSVASLETVFAPVRSQTAFEETVERLGTAIKLGLLPPGTRLPAERELCARFGIARSTLRQALVALAQSGHLHATRGRGGGTFVADPQPPATPPTAEVLADWRDGLRRADGGRGRHRRARRRARRTPSRSTRSTELIDALDGMLEDFPRLPPGRRAAGTSPSPRRRTARDWSRR